ncbi:MAG: glycine--tRNA ligase subunit beta, partial [Erythrobacter sp.]|nr:glycine--tRNA ligase subunit beta [Erythrobacter sp.]
MADFLLELLSEEIPARMQAGARAELEKLFCRELEAAGIAAQAITVHSTPRRLALIARGLPLETKAVSEEAKGPPVGAPDQAVEGFCRKNGVTRDQLEERDVKGRATWFAVIEKPGQAVLDLLAAAIPAIIADFAWPKSMRWGAASIATDSARWVRPLTGIVALLDGEVVPVVMEGLASGRETVGHRFHSSGPLTIADADSYAEALREAFVIVDHEERAALIREGARKAAEEAGLSLVADEGLVVENAGLTEWPVPLLGRFDEAFLEVPPEVIQLTARVNQKYFVCETPDGKLANAFICTANIASKDPAVVVDGNRKVLAARLSDARFFWEQDQRKTLAEHAEGLTRITFHEKLGTVADKVERVAKLAEWLAIQGIVPNCDPALARQAAKLCKADLVTEMVGEFPELQGLMGGYYAAKEGLPAKVAEAIRDHYKPVGQGDDVPTAPVTVAVSLADKLDTLFGFFDIGELPTGSKDPFALRRAAIAVIRLIDSNSLAFLINAAARHWNVDDTVGPGIAVEDFLHDRLGVMMRDSGVRYDIVQASTDLGTQSDGNIWRVRRRAEALQSFIETDNGANLLAGYKRAANILKKEGYTAAPARADNGASPRREGQGIAATGEEDPLALLGNPEFDDAMRAAAQDPYGQDLSYTPEPSEKALIDALDAAEPEAAA